MAAARPAPAVCALLLDHIVGDRAVPDDVAFRLLAALRRSPCDTLRPPVADDDVAVALLALAALPDSLCDTLRFRRGVLLRHLEANPVSPSAVSTLNLLAGAFPEPVARAAAAAHLTVAGYLVASALDFDHAAQRLMGVFDTQEAAAVADQFLAAIGDPTSQIGLRDRWGDRASAQEEVRQLIDAGWAMIGPSRLEQAEQLVGGDGATEAWRTADETSRVVYGLLVGEATSRQIIDQIHTARPSSISTPEVMKRIAALKRSSQELHALVDDPLPAAKEKADHIIAELHAKRGDLETEIRHAQAKSCTAEKVNRKRYIRWTPQEEEALRQGVKN
ncbi:hypothetical protein ACP70R_016945 [Stipagrostis hirtigluma subsp. patula]